MATSNHHFYHPCPLCLHFNKSKSTYFIKSFSFLYLLISLFCFLKDFLNWTKKPVKSISWNINELALSFASDCGLPRSIFPQSQFSKVPSTFNFTHNFPIFYCNHLSFINHIKLIPCISLVKDNLTGFIILLLEYITKLLLFEMADMVKNTHFFKDFTELLSSFHEWTLHQIFKCGSIKLVKNTSFDTLYCCCSWRCVKQCQFPKVLSNFIVLQKSISAINHFETAVLSWSNNIQAIPLISLFNHNLPNPWICDCHCINHNV